MSETESAVGDQFLPLLDIFIDPGGAARRIDRKAPWLWPVLVLVIGAAVIGYLIIPMTMRVLQMNPPANVSREAFQQSLTMMEKFQFLGVVASAIAPVIKLLILAGILKLVSMMADLQLGFRKLFSLVAHCNLILFLESIAVYVVARAKGDEIQTMEELTMPALGLDLLVRGEVGKALLAGLHFFSVFEFWYIAVLVVAFAALAKCSKLRAFWMTLPLWVLGLIFTVVASLFRR